MIMYMCMYMYMYVIFLPEMYKIVFFIIIIGSLPNLSNEFMSSLSSTGNEVYNSLALLQTSFSFVSGNESGIGNEPIKREPEPQPNIRKRLSHYNIN